MTQNLCSKQEHFCNHKRKISRDSPREASSLTNHFYAKPGIFVCRLSLIKTYLLAFHVLRKFRDSAPLIVNVSILSFCFIKRSFARVRHRNPDVETESKLYSFRTIVYVVVNFFPQVIFIFLLSLWIFSFVLH